MAHSIGTPVWDLGDYLTIDGTFHDSKGNKFVDPTTVTFAFQWYTSPGTRWVYGTVGSVSRLALGSYRVSFHLDQPGYLAWRWEGTMGTLSITDIDRVFIRYSEVD
jgi:hypothetical protein